MEVTITDRTSTLATDIVAAPAGRSLRPSIRRLTGVVAACTGRVDLIGALQATLTYLITLTLTEALTLT